MSGRRRQAVLGAAIALAPVALWHLYMGSVLFPVFRWEGFYANPHDLDWPMKGFIELWSLVHRGEYLAGLTRSAVFYPILLMAAFALSAAIAVRTRRAPAVAATLYGVLAISLNYDHIWIHMGNGTRGTYEVFLLLAIVSPEAVRLSGRWRVAVLTFWGAALAYVLYGGIDAAFVRGTLLPILP
jgi:hypothetical protein